MTEGIKNKLLGEVEHLESKSFDWMFKKALELGFTDAEIRRLKVVYDNNNVVHRTSKSIESNE